ncbi:MAG TPA: hypothetical protein PLP88_13625 [Bacteroidales bacterium]|nr:hypothetical protein [Bacteroidales bacterium]
MFDTLLIPLALHPFIHSPHALQRSEIIFMLGTALSKCIAVSGQYGMHEPQYLHLSISINGNKA